MSDYPIYDYPIYKLAKLLNNITTSSERKKGDSFISCYQQQQKSI
jgi:hypothetical protein